VKQGFDKAIPVAARLKKQDPSFNLSETELNGWGYQLLAQKDIVAAVSIFRLNVHLYPASANVYDSLAEVLESTDKKDEALANYKKSLAIDPQNKHASARIEALGGK
jgi:tetratricopeptide (TPR) repeat protein